MALMLILASDMGRAAVPVFNGAAPTLESALRLHPDTRLVAVARAPGTPPRSYEHQRHEL
jgi:hypothetical protein